MNKQQRVEQIIQQDPVTIAVNRCNIVLADLGLKISELKVDTLNPNSYENLYCTTTNDSRIITSETLVKISQILFEEEI